MRTVAVVVHGVADLVGAVKAVQVVKSSEFVVGIWSKIRRTNPHIAHQIGMFVINAGVENSNNDFFTAFRVRPRVQGVEIGLCGAAVLSSIAECPLIAKKRIVRSVGGQRAIKRILWGCFV